MKVLIVSHTVLSTTEAMGKTLLSYFSSFAPDELAQLYFHSDPPMVANACCKYYRFTDMDALYARLPGIVKGREYYDERVEFDPTSTRIDKVYRFGRKRTPMVYLMRNFIWKTAFWKSSSLRQWILGFDPDVIFFAAGDYSFSYEIALWVTKLTKASLVVSCMDDFYINNLNGQSALGRLQHRAFLQTVKKIMAHSRCIFTICDAMSDSYFDLFDRPCHTLYTAAVSRNPTDEFRQRRIVYLGNLGHLRHKSLVEIGRLLLKMDLKGGPKLIDVYSNENRPEILSEMTEENGISFRGSVSQSGVEKVMDSSMAVLHVESFDTKEKARVRMSVSTKIADALMNGPCIIAYGPEDIASIEYLKKHGAAIVANSKETLEKQLQKALTDERLREDTVSRARELAYRNHMADHVSSQVRSWLEEVIE